MCASSRNASLGGLRLPALAMLGVLGVPGAAAQGGTVRAMRVPNGGKVPDAETDRQGVIHLVYLSGDDVYYVKSSDQGKRFTAPLRVNSEAGNASGGRFRGPDLAVGKGGRIHVIWYTNNWKKKRPKTEWAVHYSQLNPAGTAFLPQRNLSHQPSDSYSLAADGQGAVAVFWISGGVFVNLSRDGGKTFSANAPVAGTDPCECCGTRAYLSPSGNLYCAYREKARNLRDMHLLMMPKGGRGFSRAKLSATPWKINACPMTGNFLSGGGKGGLVAGWETKGQVYFARLDRSGRPRAPGVIRAAARGKYPVVLSAPGGTALAAWKSGSSLHWRRYDPAGRPVGREESVRGGSADRAAGVVTPRGNFLLFY